MEFDIRDGILWKVENAEEKVIVPEGVKEIRSYCFYSDNTIVELILPDGLNRIGMSNLYSCEKLETISFPDNVNITCNIEYCPNLKKLVFRGENHKGPLYVKKCPKLDTVIMPMSRAEKSWQTFPKKVKIYDCDGNRFLTPNDLAKEQEKQKLAEEKERLSGQMKTPLLKEFVAAQKWGIQKKLDLSKLSSDQEIRDKILFVLYSYANQLKKEPVYHAKTYKTDIVPTSICKEADEIAGTIDKKLLMAAINLNQPETSIFDTEWLKHFSEPLTGNIKKFIDDHEYYLPGNNSNLEFLMPLCRFADSKTIKTLTVNAELLMKKMSMQGRRAAIAIRSGLLLSDTKEAIAYLEKYGQLKLYAEMRGKTEKEIRALITSDTGLKSDGSMSFDL